MPVKEFCEMLDRATAKVRSWPKWKQELLGDALPKRGTSMTIEELTAENERLAEADTRL